MILRRIDKKQPSEFKFSKNNSRHLLRADVRACGRNERTYRRTDARPHGITDRRTNGRMDGLTDRMDQTGQDGSHGADWT